MDHLLSAAEGAVDTNDLVRLGEIGARVSRIPVGTRRDQLSRSVVIGLAALFGGEHGSAHAAFSQALAMAAELDDDPVASARPARRPRTATCCPSTWATAPAGT